MFVLAAVILFPALLGILLAYGILVGWERVSDELAVRNWRNHRAEWRGLLDPQLRHFYDSETP